MDRTYTTEELTPRTRYRVLLKLRDALTDFDKTHNTHFMIYANITFIPTSTDHRYHMSIIRGEATLMDAAHDPYSIPDTPTQIIISIPQSKSNSDKQEKLDAVILKAIADGVVMGVGIEGR